jgi:hypothetical protein
LIFSQRKFSKKHATSFSWKCPQRKSPYQHYPTIKHSFHKGKFSMKSNSNENPNKFFNWKFSRKQISQYFQFQNKDALSLKKTNKKVWIVHNFHSNKFSNLKYFSTNKLLEVQILIKKIKICFVEIFRRKILLEL